MMIEKQVKQTERFRIVPWGTKYWVLEEWKDLYNKPPYWEYITVCLTVWGAKRIIRKIIKEEARREKEKQKAAEHTKKETIYI